MGLFNKLKNALFEEEEIEIPVRETPEIKQINVVKEDSVEPKKEPEVKKELNALLDEDNERDLFKAENTFKFPEFDEEEFKTSYKPPIEKPEKSEPIITPKESFERVKPITFEYDKKPKQTRKEIAKKEITEQVEKKTFRPSPVISPVYGVLDKNYKKEDIITVQEEKPKKKFDVDAIRKKAFGTLEDDIEKSFEKPQEEFYSRNTKNIDDLLNESADDSIEIKRERKNTTFETRSEKHTEEVVTVPETRSKRHVNDFDDEENTYSSIEQELDTTNNLQVLDENTKSEEQKFEEDTLENDLFDLIDSMYDNREEEDE